MAGFISFGDTEQGIPQMKGLPCKVEPLSGSTWASSSPWKSTWRNTASGCFEGQSSMPRSATAINVAVMVAIGRAGALIAVSVPSAMVMVRPGFTT